MNNKIKVVKNNKKTGARFEGDVRMSIRDMG
jgi:hypothetical protein